MNIYSYFDDPAKNLSVPNQRRPLWDWIIAQTKINNCSKLEQIQILQTYHSLLEGGSEIDEEKIRKEVKERVRKDRFKKAYWIEEFRDLFLFLFVYWVCIEQLYPYVFVRWIEGKKALSMIPLTLGSLLKVLFVYCIYKLLMDFMVLQWKRDSWKFWIPFIGLFLLYIGLIFVANQFNNVVLFSYPLIVVVLIFGGAFLWEWYRNKP